MIQTCQETKQQVSQQLIQERNKSTNALNELYQHLEKSIKLAQNAAQLFGVVKTQETNLSRYELRLVECQKKDQQLIRCVEKYRESEESNTDNIKVLKERYNVKWQEFEKIWYEWRIADISIYTIQTHSNGKNKR